MARETNQTAPVLKAICGAEDRPLRIGDVEIPCYVLNDGRRVITQTGMAAALGMSNRVERLADFLGTVALKSFVSNELTTWIRTPLHFLLPQGGKFAFGNEALVLADICEATLAARDAGKLNRQQIHIAKRCEKLVRGFARTGIVALIDEATGYQEIRAKDALQTMLDVWIAPELREWKKEFPDELKRQYARLTGYKGPIHPGPRYWGSLNSEFIYNYLNPEVRKWLKENRPKPKHGKNWHQSLSEGYGVRKLREQIQRVIGHAACCRDILELRNWMNLIYRGGRRQQMMNFRED